MKAYKRLLIAMTVLVGAAGVAQAADYNAPPTDNTFGSGFYLRGDGGWSFLRWNGGKDDGGFAAGGGVGYQFNQNLRGDLRVDYGGSYKIAPGADLSVTTALANLYFDIPTGMAITPYLGAGAGYGWAPINGGKDKSGMAYALMAGAGVDMSETMTLDLGYRFRGVMSSGSNPMEHQVTAGVRFKF